VEDKYVAPPHALAAQAARPVEPLPHLTLVRSTTTPGREDIEGLATALLDLGSGYEAALRTVLSMQRLLERVRRCGELSPEAVLLLQEISRQMTRLMEGGAAIATHTQATGERIHSMQGDPGE
jgi:hypothetical protein